MKEAQKLKKGLEITLFALVKKKPKKEATTKDQPDCYYLETAMK